MQIIAIALTVIFFGTLMQWQLYDLSFQQAKIVIYDLKNFDFNFFNRDPLSINFSCFTTAN